MVELIAKVYSEVVNKGVAPYLESFPSSLASLRPRVCAYQPKINLPSTRFFVGKGRGKLGARSILVADRVNRGIVSTSWIAIDYYVMFVDPSEGGSGMSRYYLRVSETFCTQDLEGEMDHEDSSR